MTFENILLTKIEILPEIYLPAIYLGGGGIKTIPVILTARVGLGKTHSTYTRKYYAVDDYFFERVRKYKPDIFSNRTLEALVFQVGESTFEAISCPPLPDNLPELIVDYANRVDF